MSGRDLIARARAGLPVTRIDKIMAETSLEELDGMVAHWEAAGDLTREEQQALSWRRAELELGLP